MMGTQLDAAAVAHFGHKMNKQTYAKWPSKWVSEGALQQKGKI